MAKKKQSTEEARVVFDAEAEKVGLDKAKNPAQTQPTRVIDFVERHYDLYLTPEGDPFAVRKNGLRRAIPFPPTGGELKNDVSLDMFAESGGVIGDTNMTAGLKIIHAKARRLEETTPLYLRCHSTTSRVVIDLAQPGNTKCVVIKDGGWSVEDAPPTGVFFKRTSQTLPLPLPAPGARGRGKKDLARILGWKLKDRYFLLTWGWLVVASLDWIPRPVLNPIGAPGSGKSSRGRALVGVLNPPGRALGSSFGKNLDDDRVKAMGSYLVGYDNLSSVSEAQSDHLCRLVSGEKSEKRQLYADTNVVSVDYLRTGVFTSIGVLQWRPDALERLIQLPLSRIKERKSETALNESFIEAHPRILGDLLDDIAFMLGSLPAMLAEQPAEAPRMADYWSALRALGSEYAEAFQASNHDTMVDAAENDPWVMAVRNWLKSVDGKFIGTPAEGYQSFSGWLIDNHPGYSSPKSQKSMTELLNKSAVPMEAIGIKFEVKRSHGLRTWRIELKKQ